MIKGKMLYNGIAVQTVEPPFAPSSTETVRLASSSPTPVGAGLYFVASYASHSCEPSARIEFREGNNTLSLVASKAIKAGEDVTVAYVPVMEEESREERQARLAKGYRFKCECTKCGAADGIDD
jgi:import receptor subunit TOM20